MMREDDSGEYCNGPDQIIPCNNLITWEPTSPVKIRMENVGFGNEQPVSIPTLIKRNATEVPNDPAMKAKDPKTGDETVWTWSDYHNDVRTVAKAFIDLGMEKYTSVCILGFNSPEWVIANCAGIFAGGFATGIYPTNGPEACKYILDHSKCNILVVEDQRQLDKVWNFRNDLPNLKSIIQYTGVPSSPTVLSWKDLLNRGKSIPDDTLESRLRGIAVNKCSTLVYTSGTTGNPKGVMLSHDNITWTTKLAARNFGMEKRNHRVLSYLPLSHVAAQMIDIHSPIVLQGTTYFADKNVMKGTLVDNLNWAKPTLFMGVPRVWEKIMEKMKEKGRDVKGLKKKISTKAKEVGLKCNTKEKETASYHLFQKIVYSKIKEALGLDQAKYFFSGAAPISKDTMNYFMSLDIKIMELYGMSESTGYHTGNTPDMKKMFTVGHLGDPSKKSKLDKAKDADDDKELCMWGRHIMMGYIYREDATKKDMSEDGWLRTGDLADIDNEGFHRIVGREKDLIITAGGENIAPQPIHDKVKEALPIISQVLLLGDKQKFVSTFLTLSVDVDPETMEPSDKLTVAAVDWCRSVGSNANTVQDVLKGPNGPDPKVMKGIQAGIDAANKEAVSNAQKIQKWMIIPRDFSIPGGEIGPTMKVKRQHVVKMYQKQINKIYS